MNLVIALRNGDEAAFARLIALYHGSMVRLAAMYVSNRETAEDVAQEAWVGVLRGLERFEGRSSLKTWIFRILMNCAKTRSHREGRSIPFSALWDPEAEPFEPAVDPERFLPPDYPRGAGHWISPPDTWNDLDEKLASEETYIHIQEVIAGLPPSQREVITLRDIEGLSAEEVCNVLSISETNQRVLLHRARSKVRRVLDQCIRGG
ncbi:MAG: RNA polymerase sigma factor [Chloroflexi bacterium]|nr:RNA polymerase sigma factor [Chloroflexota bacterium]